MRNEKKMREELVLNSVLNFINMNPEWVGTMTTLRTKLTRMLGKNLSENLPKSPAALRMTLNKIVNRLRVRRVSVKFGRTHDHAGVKYVKFLARY
jgi:hypothetical protein